MKISFVIKLWFLRKTIEIFDVGINANIRDSLIFAVPENVRLPTAFLKRMVELLQYPNPYRYKLLKVKEMIME